VKTRHRTFSQTNDIPMLMIYAIGSSDRGFL
jgi:hypothetical protein